MLSKFKDWIKQRNWNGLEQTVSAAVFAFLFGLFLAIKSPGNEEWFDRVFSAYAFLYVTLSVLELWSTGKNLIETFLASWVYFGYGAAVYGSKSFNQHHYALAVAAAWFVWNMDWKQARKSLGDFKFVKPSASGAPKPPKSGKPAFHLPKFKLPKLTLPKIGKKPQQAKPTPAPAAPTAQGQKNPAPSGQSDPKGNGNGNKGSQTQQSQPTSSVQPAKSSN